MNMQGQEKLEQRQPLLDDPFAYLDEDETGQEAHNVDDFQKMLDDLTGDDEADFAPVRGEAVAPAHRREAAAQAANTGGRMVSTDREPAPLEIPVSGGRALQFKRHGGLPLTVAQPVERKDVDEVGSAGPVASDGGGTHRQQLYATGPDFAASIRESLTPVSMGRQVTKRVEARKPKGKGGRRPYFRVMPRDLEMLKFLAQFTVATPRMLTLFTKNMLAEGAATSALERSVLSSSYWDERRPKAGARPSEDTIYHRLLRLEAGGFVRREYLYGERDPWLLAKRGYSELMYRDLLAGEPEPKGVGRLSGDSVPHLLAVALVAAQIQGGNRDSALRKFNLSPDITLVSEPEVMSSYFAACRRARARDDFTKQALLIRARTAFGKGDPVYHFPLGVNVQVRNAPEGTDVEEFQSTEAFRWLLPAMDNWESTFGRFRPSEKGNGLAYPKGESYRASDLIVRDGDRTFAVEVELSKKATERYANIMAKYAADSQLEAVAWVVTKEAVAKAIVKAAQVAGCREKTYVHLLRDGFGAPLDGAYNLAKY